MKKELLNGINEVGFREPTEVQDRVISVAMEGKDMVVRSKTGTGKTGAFAIPILNMLHEKDKGVKALIIAPTRELALQIEGVINKIGKYTGLKSTVVYGGVSTRPQSDSIRNGAHIVVGTPGRLLDLMERRVLDLSNVRVMVIDEADIMLDMGFIEDVQQIIENAPRHKQMLLFSATMPERIKEITVEYMHGTIEVGIGKEEELSIDKIENAYALSTRFSKFSLLLAYLAQTKPDKSIIFTRTQRNAEILYRILKGEGFNPSLLHGGITQARREYTMKNFRHNTNGILIATNIAARGIDVVDISDIINFDAPDDPIVYLHRVGRSARMGRTGKAFTIFEESQEELIGAIERYAGIRFKRLQLDTRMFSKVNFGKYVGSGRNEREQRGPGRYHNERGPGRYHDKGSGRRDYGHRSNNRFKPRYNEYGSDK